MSQPWKGDMWFVSPFNYDEDLRKKLSMPKKVIFHDTTLRDGEQQAGIIFNKYDKMTIAKALNRIGVDRIEVGIPGISDDDREAIRALIAASLDAKIYSWCRNNKSDISIAKECGSQGIMIEVPASKQMIEKVYSTSIEELESILPDNIQYAKSEGMEVSVLLVDATRSDIETIRKIISIVEKYCDGIAISDTFGSITPLAMFNFISKIKEFTKKPIEIHCHNDFGLATANAITAVAAGASCVHTTVIGIGERAGNASLGEVAVALKLLMGVESNIKLKELYRIAQIIAQYSGIPIPPNKPIVGQNIFRIESEQAAKWLIKGEPLMAYPFTKELIGNPKLEITLSKKSGPHTLQLKLNELKISIPEEKYSEVLSRIYQQSIEKKSALTDEEFLEILETLGIYKYKVEDYMRA
jgi:isopropylmalate/homocitrate/citramalate synthase